MLVSVMVKFYQFSEVQRVRAISLLQLSIPATDWEVRHDTNTIGLKLIRGQS